MLRSRVSHKAVNYKYGSFTPLDRFNFSATRAAKNFSKMWLFRFIFGTKLKNSSEFENHFGWKMYFVSTSCQARLSRLPETDIGAEPRKSVCKFEIECVPAFQITGLFEGELRFYSKEQSLRSKLSFI